MSFRSIAALAVVVAAARAGGAVAARLRQPRVLGELAAGLVLGNLVFAGVSALDYLKIPVHVAGEGARVDQVMTGAPADGVLLKDDVIVSVDGRPVAIVSDLTTYIQKPRPGTRFVRRSAGRSSAPA